jgi:hypothetical protein
MKPERIGQESEALRLLYQHKRGGILDRREILALMQSLSITAGYYSRRGTTKQERQHAADARRLAKYLERMAAASPVVHAPAKPNSRALPQTRGPIHAAANGRVYLAPGTAALCFLGWFVSKRTIERIYEQTVRDMREEHIEALAAQRFGRARWICILGHASLLATTLKLVPIALLKRFYEMWKAI